MKPTQRFVAGANCPSCGEMDSLLIDSQDQSIECVDCGYQQSPEQRDEPAPTQSVSSKKVKSENIIQVTQLKD